MNSLVYPFEMTILSPPVKPKNICDKSNDPREVPMPAYAGLPANPPTNNTDATKSAPIVNAFMI